MLQGKCPSLLKAVFPLELQIPQGWQHVVRGDRTEDSQTRNICSIYELKYSKRKRMVGRSLVTHYKKPLFNKSNSAFLLKPPSFSAALSCPSKPNSFPKYIWKFLSLLGSGFNFSHEPLGFYFFQTIFKFFKIHKQSFLFQQEECIFETTNLNVFELGQLKVKKIEWPDSHLWCWWVGACHWSKLHTCLGLRGTQRPDEVCSQHTFCQLQLLVGA